MEKGRVGEELTVSRPSEMVPTNLQRKDNGYILEPDILADVQSCV